MRLKCDAEKIHFGIDQWRVKFICFGVAVVQVYEAHFIQFGLLIR